MMTRREQELIADLELKNAESTTSSSNSSATPRTNTSTVSTADVPAVLHGTLESRQHVIHGTWNYENSGTVPSLDFSLKSIKARDETDTDLLTLSKYVEFSGSFQYIGSGWKQRSTDERSRFVSEYVKIKFTKTEGSDYKVDGTGENEFGKFAIDGTAKPTQTHGHYSIELRKRYKQNNTDTDTDMKSKPNKDTGGKGNGKGDSGKDGTKSSNKSANSKGGNGGNSGAAAKKSKKSKSSGGGKGDKRCDAKLKSRPTKVLGNMKDQQKRSTMKKRKLNEDQNQLVSAQEEGKQKRKLTDSTKQTAECSGKKSKKQKVETSLSGPVVLKRLFVPAKATTKHFWEYVELVAGDDVENPTTLMHGVSFICNICEGKGKQRNFTPGSTIQVKRHVDSKGHLDALKLVQLVRERESK